MEKPFRLAIFGSRSLSDERIRILILEAIEKYNPTAIVTAFEPEGVCTLAQLIARERAIPLTTHFLNFRFLRGAFEKRSKAVLNDCDHCVLIHDGESKGTSNEIKLCEKLGVEHSVFVEAKSEYTRSVGFPLNERDEWT